MSRLILFLIFFVLLLVRFGFSLQANRNLDRYVGRQISLTSKISSNINLQGGSQNLNISRIRVRTTLYPTYAYGDTLAISGTLQRQVINHWYSRFSLMYPRIEKVESGNNLFIGLKESLESWYARILPEPEAGLMAGIVLGSKRGLPREFWLALQKTGTLHIVVASGFNVTVVMGAIIFLFAGLVKRWQAVILALAGVMLYSFIAGMEPAIIRAAIMGSLACLAQAFGRQGTALRLLFLAAGAMLLVNPLYLFDVGFQLSVLATLGLISVSPHLPEFLPKGMKETISAQLLVWPILLINFNQLSLIGILVNSLIVLFVPYVMFLFWLPWLAYVPLHLMVVIINCFA